uniref:Uncharacterized protein n=1 Tax=Caenorhabditis japonica TaxID=281687 RepID=A0A8R1DI73_CAEJA
MSIQHSFSGSILCIRNGFLFDKEAIAHNPNHLHVLCGDGFTLVSTTEQQLYFWGRKDLVDDTIYIEDLEETMTEKKMKGTTTNDNVFDKNVVTLPSLILRLQDERGNKGVRLSGLAVASRKVHVVVDMLEGRREDSKAKKDSLMREIEDLKKKIKEQDTTFEGHRNQMSGLESKLQELQAKQAFLRKSEPPPAYDRRNVSYNKLFPEKANTSTACVIL